MLRFAASNPSEKLRSVRWHGFCCNAVREMIMRYGLRLGFALALSLALMEGCSDPTPAPCVDDEDCNDGDACTIDYCFGAVVSMRYCKHDVINCRTTLPAPYDSECARAEYEVCDPEAPEDQVCGDIRYMNGGEYCDDGFLCLFGWRQCVSGECVCALNDCRDYEIFVTETVQDAALGGIEGADALCASQAAAAGLKGDFAAWLSTSTTAVAERVLHSSCNYTLVDSTWVAYDWEDLTDGDIWVPINLDANGVIQDGDVWTGTEPDGSSYEGGDCSGFTSASSELVSLAGSTESNDASWTAEQTQACSTPLRLYCVQTLR